MPGKKLSKQEENQSTVAIMVGTVISLISIPTSALMSERILINVSRNINSLTNRYHCNISLLRQGISLTH